MRLNDIADISVELYHFLVPSMCNMLHSFEARSFFAMILCVFVNHGFHLLQNTALITAASAGRDRSTRALTAAGADVSMKDVCCY